jgi:hypothetical protein
VKAAIRSCIRAAARGAWLQLTKVFKRAAGLEIQLAEVADSGNKSSSEVVRSR